LSVRSVEVANNAGFLWVFPLTFIANTFVPLKTLPRVLRAIAEWSPVTCVVSAARDLFGNSDGGRPTGNFATQHPAAMSLIWSIGILAVFVPLAVRKYKKSASR
jgi:ABC-type multidrug transport system permease subunit